MDELATGRWDTRDDGLLSRELEDVLGWAATTIGVVLLAIVGMLPIVVALLLGIVGIGVGTAVLIAAHSRQGRGAGHGVAGIIFSVVAVLAAPTLWMTASLTTSIVSGVPGVGSGAAAGPATQGPAVPGAHEAVRLMPQSAAASTTAPPVADGGGVVTFDATKVLDGDASTAWRTVGDGVGETITVALGRPVRLAGIGVIAGYASTDNTTWVDRFGQNGRVASARFTLDDGRFTDVTFVDLPQLQTFELTGDTTALQMTILSSTPGSSPYTALSEVELYGWLG
jgi:hypothetical protein